MKWNNYQSMFALKLYFFLLILYAVIFNSLLTVPVALHFQCFQHFDYMNMKSVCFSKQEGHDGPGSLTLIIFPTNEFYIFVPLVPTCGGVGPVFDPKGHHVNKIDKGLQGDATYRKSKLYLFQFQRRRILKLVFFVPMFQLVNPWVGSVLTPKESHE